MSAYSAVYRILDRFNLLEAAKPAARSALIAARKAAGTDRNVVDQYLSANPVAKLHIGAGFYHIEGWLNSDYNPKPGVIVVDAARTFPFRDAIFDYIYCEHMIEHIDFISGGAMLRECARVLKPGGVVRIVTPNLASLIALHEQPEEDLHRRYMAWTAEEMQRVGTGAQAPSADPVFIINYFVRAWGHQFIYNEASLRFSFGNAGLADAVREASGSSEHPPLRNLEHVDRLPPDFYEFESLVMEAVKPTAKPSARA